MKTTIVLEREIDEVAFARDAVAIEDVELDLLERRRHLVLHDLHAGAVADGVFAHLDGAGAADVQAHGGVELQRIAAGGGLRRTEHDADLHADLVDEDDDRVRALDVAGELAQRLRHQSRLQARQRVAHVAFDLGARGQCRHRVDDHQVDRTRTHQGVGDFQGLFTGVRLRDQQLAQVNAQLLRVTHVERVLGIHEGSGATQALGLGDDLQGQRRLAR